jgi:hypothetical protein
MRQARVEIGGVTEGGDGSITVRFTYGEDVVLPLGWSGAGKNFSSRLSLAEYIAAAEAVLTEDILLGLILGKALKIDPTLSGRFRAEASGKTAVVDLSGSGVALSL